MNNKDQTWPANIQWVPNFKILSQRFSGLIIAIGCLVLIGWILNIEALKSIVPGLATMKSMTALLFVLSGLSLWMQAREERRQIVQICTFTVMLTGLLTLGEYFFRTDIGIDQLLFRDTSVGAIYPGRMSPATALSFVMISLGLTFLNRLPGKWFDQAPVILALAISVLALIGYLYDVSSLYQFGAYTSMALHTALSFTLLSLGIFFARPERGIMQTILADNAGGPVLRRFLPVTLVLPVVLGWIGFWGQQAGLYDTAFGLALMAISLITTMTILIWINARQLTEMDTKRQQVDASLRASELRFRSTLESMMEGCQIIGYDWRYIYINTSAEKQNRRPTKELLGKIYMDMWPGVESTAVYVGLRQCMDKRIPQHLVTEFIFPDGSRGWFELSIEPVPDGIFILSSDITERKRAEQALLEREMKLAILLDILPVGISILDGESKISYTNRALKEMLDLSEEELRKGTYKNRTYLRADGTLMPVDELARTRALKEKREIVNIETGVITEDDSIVWTSVSAVPVDFPDWKVVLVTSDITERKQAEQKISRLNAGLEEKVAQRTLELAAANKQLYELSIMDDLTGLHNRRGFHMLAEEQLLLARRTGCNLLLFYGDLDGLKQVNDQQGHVAGDQAIITVSQALNKTFRSSDIKARLGGDEFIVMAINCIEPDAPTLLARLQERLTKQGLSMSVGVIDLDTQRDLSMAELIKRADEAMYEAKFSKRGRRREAD